LHRACPVQPNALALLNGVGEASDRLANLLDPPQLQTRLDARVRADEL